MSIEDRTMITDMQREARYEARRAIRILRKQKGEVVDEEIYRRLRKAFEILNPDYVRILDWYHSSCSSAYATAFLAEKVVRPFTKWGPFDYQ